MNVEKEVSETTQTDNQLIETIVETALERLYISEDERMAVKESNIDVKESSFGHIVSSLDNMITEKRETSLVDHIHDKSSADSSIVISKKLKSEHICDTNDILNQISISDHITSSKSSASGSPEPKTCDVSSSEIIYVNAVLNEALGKPVVNRYPLKYRWQLWFWRADQGVKIVWEEALQQVCKPFETIEDFWCLYHHILCVQQLVPPSDYCVFKEGIRPMWEDIHNINGGKWILEFTKGPKRESNPHLDEIWLEVLLCLIGEGFNDFGEEMCGAVVNIRSKEDRITVWTADANKSVSNLKIGEILKMRTGYQGKLKYEAHSTSLKIAEAKERVVKPKRLITTNRRSCIF